MSLLKSLSLFLIICVNFTLQAKAKIDFSYPDSLEQGADAVLIFDNTTYERSSFKDLVETRFMAVCILNNRADDFTHMFTSYDDLMDIRSISCAIYSKSGDLIKKFKKDEIQDISYYSNYTLYSDNRVKYAHAINRSYPYVIVFEYTTAYDGFWGLSSWSPVHSYRLAVHNAKLEVITPTDAPFIFKPINEDQMAFEMKEVEGDEQRIWRVSNYKALEWEHYSPSLSRQTPRVLLTPRDFEYDGYTGSNATWKEVGAFCKALLYEENELTEQTKIDLDNIKNEASDERDLTKHVYEYMQSKTRYVGIQEGIGGWQPFPSLTVDETGYGDCKALSYYTKTLLDYVGVKSIYTVIGNGSVKIKYDDFTSNQTNHAILCVPFSEDTVWLECTSQITPFNFLSASSKNRKALLVTEDGGRLQYIPQKVENKRERVSVMSLQSDGRLLCDNTLTYYGKFFDDNLSLSTLSPKELDEYLQKNTPVSDIEIKECSAEMDKDNFVLKVHNNFCAANNATIAGDRIFVDLSPFAQIQTIKKQKEERRCDVVLTWNNTYQDSLELIIPEGYAVEFLPENQEQENDYVDYSFQVKVEDNRVIVAREFRSKKGKFGKKYYGDFVDTYNDIAKNDRCKVSFKKL